MVPAWPAVPELEWKKAGNPAEATPFSQAAASSGDSKLLSLMASDRSVAMQFYVRCLMLCCVVVFVIPLGRISYQAYRSFFFGAFGASVLAVGSAVGRPKMSLDFANRVMRAPESQARGGLVGV